MAETADVVVVGGGVIGTSTLVGVETATGRAPARKRDVFL